MDIFMHIVIDYGTRSSSPVSRLEVMKDLIANSNLLDIGPIAKMPFWKLFHVWSSRRAPPPRIPFIESFDPRDVVSAATPPSEEEGCPFLVWHSLSLCFVTGSAVLLLPRPRGANGVDSVT